MIRVPSRPTITRGSSSRYPLCLPPVSMRSVTPDRASAHAPPSCARFRRNILRYSCRFATFDWDQTVKILSSSTFFPFYHRDFDFDDSIKQPCFHRESCVRTTGSIMYRCEKESVHSYPLYSRALRFQNRYIIQLIR